MVSMKFILLALTLGALTVPAAYAQAACRSDAAPYRDFDFWVGTWSDFDVENEKNGETTVTLEGRGCLLLEKWTSNNGATGAAMMFYDQDARNWRRIWRSAGHQIEATGGRDEDGNMVLVGDATHLASGDTFPIRARWQAQPEAVIEVSIERLDPETDAYSAWAKLVHRPR